MKEKTALVADEGRKRTLRLAGVADMAPGKLAEALDQRTAVLGVMTSIRNFLDKDAEIFARRLWMVITVVSSVAAAFLSSFLTYQFTRK